MKEEFEIGQVVVKTKDGSRIPEGSIGVIVGYATTGSPLLRAVSFYVGAYKSEITTLVHDLRAITGPVSGFTSRYVEGVAAGGEGLTLESGTQVIITGHNQGKVLCSYNYIGRDYKFELNPRDLQGPLTESTETTQEKHTEAIEPGPIPLSSYRAAVDSLISWVPVGLDSNGWKAAVASMLESGSESTPQGQVNFKEPYALDVLFKRGFHLALALATYLEHVSTLDVRECSYEGSSPKRLSWAGINSLRTLAWIPEIDAYLRGKAGF